MSPWGLAVKKRFYGVFTNGVTDVNDPLNLCDGEMSNIMFCDTNRVYIQFSL